MCGCLYGYGGGTLEGPPEYNCAARAQEELSSKDQLMPEANDGTLVPKVRNVSDYASKDYDLLI